MLRKFLKPGDTVYCVLRSRSKSGMSRRIDFYKIVKPVRGSMNKQPCPQFLTGWMSVLRPAGMTWNPDKTGGLVHGVGMDMGFAVVYDLAEELFGDGYKLKSEWI